MMQFNYFSHFGLPISFDLDHSMLKKSFLKLSRELHPDFNQHKNEFEEELILEKASFNNLAYKILKSEDLRFKYILELHGLDFGEGKSSLPQMFLMEMMDFNEKLMDVQMEADLEAISSLKSELKEIESALYVEIEKVIQDYQYESISEEDLNKLKDYYFKKRYLLRIHENLNKFEAS